MLQDGQFAALKHKYRNMIFLLILMIFCSQNHQFLAILLPKKQKMVSFRLKIALKTSKEYSLSLSAANWTVCSTVQLESGHHSVSHTYIQVILDFLLCFFDLNEHAFETCHQASVTRAFFQIVEVFNEKMWKRPKLCFKKHIFRLVKFKKSRMISRSPLESYTVVQ